ncbi:MAG: hypothetical protein V5A43_10205 [Haloarculaceae archaeon]
MRRSWSGAKGVLDPDRSHVSERFERVVELGNVELVNAEVDLVDQIRL